ncbi:FxLYD domain-containing protein [Paraburkholderia sp. J10-1]|uniref:FxLYD domain-containing protein n=1 Tax=Paraburkholderia sp. J10-1 TaxID=2805430 RepID=UPI002AB7BEA8|nr:FxLYD domain-containing protein [Paraburkholderia sp. J10-1]
MKKLVIATLISLTFLSAHAESALQLSDMKATVSPGTSSGFIAGTATNTSPDRIESATITINLLDAQGNIVGNTSAVAFGIAPGQKWLFRAITTIPYERSEVVSVRTM